MKVLVIYDTVSASKLTGTVAQTIAETLKSGGGDVDSFFVGDMNKSRVKDYDCVIAGAPTMAFRLSKTMAEFLDGLSSGEFAGKRAAAFDTQVKAMISGNAAKAIEKKLKSLGFAVFKEPLVVYVEGAGKDLWRFKTGELEKVKAWTLETAKTLSQ